MDFREKEKKILSSEGMEHERVSDPSRKKKLEGYEPHPTDKDLSEVFGLKNSFDNISVGADPLGRMTITVTSQKGYHSDTLTSDRKKMKTSRKRIFYEHFGEFYTNSFSRGSGAFSFRTRRNLPESRILREMRKIAFRRITEEQREAMPILSLEDDKKRLTELRSMDDRDPEIRAEKQSAEKVIVRKTEMENRFTRRIRLARRQTYKPPVLDDNNRFGTLFLKDNDLPDDDRDEDDNDTPEIFNEDI